MKSPRDLISDSPAIAKVRKLGIAHAETMFNGALADSTVSYWKLSEPTLPRSISFQGHGALLGKDLVITTRQEGTGITLHLVWKISLIRLNLPNGCS